MQGRQGRWASIKESFSSFLSSSVNAAKTVGGVGKAIWRSETLRTKAQAFSLEAWSGISFSSFFSLFPTLVRYGETRGPILGQMPDGITSFGGFIPDNTVLLYLQVALAGGVSFAVHNTEWKWTAVGVDIAIYLYFLRQKFNRDVANSLTRAAILKAATPNDTELKKTMHKHLLFKPCAPKVCGETASVMADVMAIPESMADTIFSYSFAHACSLLFFNLKNPIPYVNELILYPLLSLKYGRDILRVKLSSVGMCESHRNDIITANNAYCVAKGASFLIGVYGVPKLVSWGLNSYGYTWAANFIDNEFVSGSIFALGYLSFTQAELQITNTLPGTKPGRDIFKHVHLAAQEVTKGLVSELVAICWNSTSEATWEQQLHTVKETYQSEPMKLAMTVSVGRDAMSLRAFLKRASAHSFITTFERSLKENVEWLTDLRYEGLARTILKVLPGRVLDPATKSYLVTWGSKAMDGPAQSLNDLIEKIYPGAFKLIQPKQTLISRDAVAELATVSPATTFIESVAKEEKKEEEKKIEPVKRTTSAPTHVPNLGFLGRQGKPSQQNGATQEFKSFLTTLSKHKNKDD